MKHISRILLLFTLIFLTACKQSTVSYRIGISQCSDDEWRNQMNEEIMREALFYDGIELDIRTARDNSTQQIEDIRTFIANGIDLLIVSPNEAAIITPVVEEAFDSGIPVIVVDRKILSDKYTAFIGADNYEIGKAVGNYIVTLLNGNGNIVEIKGLSGSTPALERHQGFISIINRYPEITLIQQVEAAWLRDPARICMDSILLSFPKIDVVYAHNDRMAAGAFEAAYRANRSDSIHFIGIDALPGKDYGLGMVLDSILTATFIYPTGGDVLMQTAMKILRDETFLRENILNTAVVDATNARVMSLQTNQIGELDVKIKTLNSRIDSFGIRYTNQQLLLYSILIILLLLAGLLVVVIKSLRSKNKMNQELKEQKGQLETQRDTLSEQRDQLINLSEQLEEATHAKLAFFTNISHDFRTPLTLVADPIEQLMDDETISVDQHRKLSLVQRNVNILLRLVNQILDFRKYENGKMDFLPSSIDMLQCFTVWNEAFNEAIRKKHIHFSFDAMPNESYQTLADAEKLERIYYNLLSNAVKFTPENGKITVRLSSLKDQDEASLFRFSIHNTGSLIDATHIHNIFDRFYKTDLHHAGSGIGLALVKAFVEMHGGTINVESDTHYGTTFTVDIPRQNVPVQRTDTVVSNTTAKYEEEEIAEDMLIDTTCEKSIILVVDDNIDIRLYIRELLQDKYMILEASNGQQGLKLANRYVPDLILSDVMMPEMDGFEFCTLLKNEMRTCHIPMIMLTACSLDEQRIKGYLGGADSYISKPFNSKLLLARIDNLITSNLRLKQVFGDNQTLIKEDVCDMDKTFITRFKSLVEERLSDSALNVEDLGREMGMSRVQLYRKLKSLTNYSPNELLRITRLKRAQALLSSANSNVGEISYTVGFSSPSYFAKCYKEYYGESPTDFLRRMFPN